MTKKEELVEEFYNDLIHYIERELVIEMQPGLFKEFKLSHSQKRLLKHIVTCNMQSFQTVSSSRIRKGFKI